MLFSLLAYAMSCTSPRERSQALTEEILKGLVVPEEATLLHVKKFERLAKQGVGTSFGLQAYYGINKEYTSVVEQYQNLLSDQGWREYAHTTWEHPWFCNRDYQNVSIELRSISFKTISATNMFPITETTYDTFYRITVVQFPFDDIGDCQDNGL